MHDGAYQTLWDVVNHYNFGGATGQLCGRARIRRIAPLLLTDAELGDLVEFLRALDDGALQSVGRSHCSPPDAASRSARGAACDYCR